VLISAVYILLTSCSVLRRERSVSGELSNDLNKERLINIMTLGNLSDSSFYIQKADVEFIMNGEKQRFLVSWKYEKPGRSLLSFRSRTGIEAARILITKDTILINDRINRKIYFGKGNYVEWKYNISVPFLPAMIGDFIGGHSYFNNKEICNGGIIALKGSVKGLKTDYIIDCKKAKVVSTSIYNSLNEKEIELNFSKFIRVDKKIVASKIAAKYYKKDYEINIKIGKIIYPWDGKVEFIPGKRYEAVELN
jgi:hypothetical protein